MYHRRYCPEYTDPFSNRDLLIDSSRFGIEKTAEMLSEIVRDLFVSGDEKEKWNAAT